ncbi:GalNAc-alpha-(1-_4)-GalNAc-alpha-(1-_3)-diNAcBac-PP-undecaprenol alpha-1,4-N-acetyl-D-galactosaminyltransferase [Jejuia pallidilutea]|uniref:GalNAc-alpha-(1->4)-GalNAc-alpha-(1->3)-diNAcBac-PP-undecaprenol alpha-1,4-N-acetyl-D-galactosaminyltransferase n=1 Tax=Jejuia pallidilutea TaxID=504487 RepID=A0A362WZU7_9FLAO|nr:glycosyltransferase family 4 protein [Jejuia pallidilutea]PQV47695.1 GalNAc-alpha-(1->4)-GalNAc-alpha-(1->3)-diNAcBac-PP-undecaprenol alpha-1,4-N-acetyl-D-galactosaminyltransferase [Jejuia pallidilutea]
MKKKIGFVIPSLGPGGAERVVVSLANKLICKYNIHLILLYKESNILYNVDERIIIHNCSEYLLKSTNLYQAFKNNYKTYNVISSYTKNNKIDCLIGFTTTSNILTVLSAKSNKIPCIISDRSNPYVNQLNWFWKTIRYLTYPLCNYLVVQTQLSKQFYAFIKKDKLKVLPNPLSKDLTEKRDSYVKKENIILYVARLDENKSQDTLLKAFSKLNLTDWKLVLVGDGNKRTEYEALAKKLNIYDRVIFTGRINNPDYYYNRAKIFAFTSKSEGFPNALIEALYFGLPCVSTNCPSGPSELIDEGRNGYLVPVDDFDLLHKKLNLLINDEKLRYNFSKYAKEKSKQYHVDEVSKKWEFLIKDLI